MTLRPTTDVSVADWFSTDPRTDASLGPARFESYLRLLLPGRDQGIEGHLDSDALALLVEVLARHTTTPEQCFFGLWDGYGEIYGGEAVAFLTTFAGPARWPGRPFRPEAPRKPPPPAFGSDVMDAPRVSAGSLEYLLFSGPLEQAGQWGALPFGPSVPREINSPNLMWPADHAWFVTTHVDETWAGVAGSADLVNDLLTTDGLETVRTTHPEHR